ncbi:MAG: RluA family pseudouridine synthase [Pseudomonadota bacterium]
MTVQYITVTKTDQGQRLDNFLIRELKGVPKSRIYKIVRSGEVRVNSGRVKASFRLCENDKIRIPPIRTATRAPVIKAGELGRSLKQRIVFEDTDLIALDKPAGLAVHGGSGVDAGVVEILRASMDHPRLELVHRLDRGTSGILLIAKSRPALVQAQKHFRHREVQKIYNLLVHGRWPVKKRVIQDRLLRYTTPWGERRVKVDDNGMQARTDFQILETSSQVTLLQARIHTGRTHQIRVHAATQGHPVVGDEKYKSSEGPYLSDVRLCLHARKLVIPHLGQPLKLEVPVPEEFSSVWGQLNS